MRRHWGTAILAACKYRAASGEAPNSVQSRARPKASHHGRDRSPGRKDRSMPEAKADAKPLLLPMAHTTRPTLRTCRVEAISIPTRLFEADRTSRGDSYASPDASCQGIAQPAELKSIKAHRHPTSEECAWARDSTVCIGIQVASLVCIARHAVAGA